MGYNVGPMTVGENLPKTPATGDPEGKYGVAMNCGPEDKKFSPRTAAKFKSFQREQVPKTGKGEM